MTKEERASMRSTWQQWHKEGKILPSECFKCTGRNSRDVLRLLDALDETEAENKALKTYIKSLWNDGGCQACVYDETRTFGKPCNDCGFDMHNWVFDQGRFYLRENNE